MDAPLFIVPDDVTGVCRCNFKLGKRRILKFTKNISELGERIYNFKKL